MWLYFPPSPSSPAPEDSSAALRPLSPRWVSLFAQLCTWRGKLSPWELWLKRWAAAPWLQRLSGLWSTTAQRSCTRRYGAWLRDSFSPSPWGRRASRTRPLASGSTPKTTVGSGPPSAPGLLRFDPASSSWRTCQGSLWVDSMSSSATLPRSGTMRSGTVTPRQKRKSHGGETLRIAGGSDIAHLKNANGSSWSEFYPTPSATSYGSSQNEGTVPHDRPSRGTPSLETWAKKWPGDQDVLPMRVLPQEAERPGLLRWDAEQLFHRFLQDLATGEDGAPSSPPADGTCSQLSLETKNGFWPTPRATQTRKMGSEYRDGKPASLSLPHAAELWARLTSRDHKKAASLTKTKGGRDLSKEVASEGRRLNPRFVAWLMGWLEPADLQCFGITGSTDSEPSETASCRLKRRLRSAS